MEDAGQAGTAQAAETAGQGGRWRVVAVVGAGRSGTSTLTAGVGALGVELGARLKGRTAKNPKGFFEDADLLDVNYRLRAALGLERGGGGVVTVAPARYDEPAVRALHDEAAALIGRRFGACPLWGFKSGGTLQLLPFWQRVFAELGLEAGYVLALRNPLAVARSRAKLGSPRGVQEWSDLEWLVRVVPHFRSMAGRPLVVVDYDRLLDDPRRELGRVARGLGLPLGPEAEAGIEAYAREFLSGGLRHSRFGLADLEREPRASPLARDAYRALYGLACDEAATDSPAFGEEWARIEAALEAMRPSLGYLQRLEEERRRRPGAVLQAGWRRLRRLAARERPS